MTFKIYAIVVTFNGAAWIEKCINSLVNSTAKLKIIVIDNNSSDDTASIIEKNFKEVELIKSPLNLGFGKANNIGLKKALKENADYTLLLNQDAWVQTGTLYELIQLAGSKKSIGIVAPLNLKPDGQSLELGCQKELTANNCPGLFSDLALSKVSSISQIKEYYNASCWLIARECLVKVGGFDPLFSHYGEDVNYCNRLTYNKLTVYVAPKVYSYHAKDNFRPKVSDAKIKLIKAKTDYLNNYLINKLTRHHINYFKVFMYEVRVLCGNILNRLVRLKFVYVKMYLEILWFLLKNHNKIASRQSLYKTNGAHFLV